jgi:phytoene/squalene synthetase
LRAPRAPSHTHLPTRRRLKPLEEPYRGRAAPLGSARYWSWLFAARPSRAPLLGVYALLAEWRALLDPATDAGVAEIKFAWWRAEIERLCNGVPVHPISRYLAQWPRAQSQLLEQLTDSIDAALLQIARVPLELNSELAPHADRLYGTPLRFAAELAGWDTSGESTGASAVRGCTAALAVGEYLTRAVADYRRDFRVGRVTFPIDDLLAARVENGDLAAATPPPHLQTFLSMRREWAKSSFAHATDLLPVAERSALRHMSVLAALGAQHAQENVDRSDSDFRFADLYNAWNAARRAAAAR